MIDEEQKLCECGCGCIVKYGNRFIHGHNTRVNNPGKKPSKETREKISISMKEYRVNNPLSDEEYQQLSDANKVRWSDPLQHIKQSEMMKERFENPIEREKAGEIGKEHYGKINPKEEISQHHIAYDFNDHDALTVMISRSFHSSIHHPKGIPVTERGYSLID